METSNQPPLYWVAYGFGLFGGALVVGVVVGLLPFFFARRCGQRKTAWFGFITCIFASLLFGIVGAAPTALAFAVAIYVRRPSVQGTIPASIPPKAPSEDA